MLFFSLFLDRGCSLDFSRCESGGLVVPEISSVASGKRSVTETGALRESGDNVAKKAKKTKATVKMDDESKESARGRRLRLRHAKVQGKELGFGGDLLSSRAHQGLSSIFLVD